MLQADLRTILPVFVGTGHPGVQTVKERRRCSGTRVRKEQAAMDHQLNYIAPLMDSACHRPSPARLSRQHAAGKRGHGDPARGLAAVGRPSDGRAGVSVGAGAAVVIRWQRGPIAATPRGLAGPGAGAPARCARQLDRCAAEGSFPVACDPMCSISERAAQRRTLLRREIHGHPLRGRTRRNCR